MTWLCLLDGRSSRARGEEDHFVTVLVDKGLTLPMGATTARE